MVHRQVQVVVSTLVVSLETEQRITSFFISIIKLEIKHFLLYASVLWKDSFIFTSCQHARKLGIGCSQKWGDNTGISPLSQTEIWKGSTQGIAYVDLVCWVQYSASQPHRYFRLVYHVVDGSGNMTLMFVWLVANRHLRSRMHVNWLLLSWSATNQCPLCQWLCLLRLP